MKTIVEILDHHDEKWVRMLAVVQTVHDTVSRPDANHNVFPMTVGDVARWMARGMVDDLMTEIHRRGYRPELRGQERWQQHFFHHIDNPTRRMGLRMVMEIEWGDGA